MRPMIRNGSRPIAMTLAMLAALACSGCATPQRVQPLDEAVRVYNDSVRWQRFTMAADQVPATERDDFLDRRDQLAEDLRITDYEVIRVRYDRTGRRARVQVKVTWHLDSQGVVRETHTVQTWRRQGSIWVLAGEQHLRGEPMPGVDSPESGGERNEQGDDIRSGDALRHEVN